MPASPPNSHPITDSRRVHPTVKPQVRLWSDILPASWKPFIELSRVDMICGGLLMFWPCVWGVLAASYRSSESISTVFIQLPVYFFGSFLLRSLICTWNDMCDKDLDAQVERTKHRPLAAGRISVRAAAIFAIVQLVLFLLLLTQLRSPHAFKATVFGLCILQPPYPFLKRITNWPQAWLPFVMNWGIIIAWVDNAGIEDYRIVIYLFLASFCWSIYYDTIYATMDVKDDLRIGIKSTAVLFGGNIKWLLALFATGVTAFLTLFGLSNGQGQGFYVISVFMTSCCFLWQLITWDVRVPQSSFRRFDQNGRWIGALIASGLAYDYLSAQGFKLL